MKNYNALRLALTMICAIFLLTAKGQHNAIPGSYDGIWAGLLENSKKDKLVIIVQISNGMATKYRYNQETKKLEKYTFPKEATMAVGNNLSYTWMNKGGVWSETQTHMISYLRPDVIRCRLIRQVTNAQASEDDPDLNEEWSTYFMGTLDRFKSIQELENTLKSDG
ncbi:hypothetical protein [Pedobacter gandavensis]|uniref:hypothetical protein n=1 Tax=Pedobacter gandavensis TaxID=2679963 RepID=UPI00292CDB81|nr:hypothetical protein [Pedobacter gandavensis]